MGSSPERIKNTMTQSFYHITTENNARKILQQGLKPQIGPNSRAINETQPAIYFCKKEDIPYWQILLDSPIVLRISGLTDENVSSYNYSYYNEYIYQHDIPAKAIRKVSIKINRQQAMINLCMSYLDYLSYFTVHCARYYFYNRKNTALFENIQAEATCIEFIMRNLDYSVLSKQTIRKHFKELGESGEYTICDKYCGTDHTLLEQLILYPEDETSELRSKIYRYFKKYLKGCLHVNTGGWCG